MMCAAHVGDLQAAAAMVAYGLITVRTSMAAVLSACPTSKTG